MRQTTGTGRISIANRHIRVCAVLVCLVTCLATPVGLPGVAGAQPARIPSLAGRALAFEPNVGQAAASARFVARSSGTVIFFQPDRVILTISSGTQTGPSPPATVRLRLLNANPSAGLAPG